MLQAAVHVQIKGCEQHDETSIDGDENREVTIKVSISVNGTDQGQFTSKVKLTDGDTFGVRNVEMARPEGYTGPYDHGIFSWNIAGYYRGALRRFAGIGPYNKRPKNTAFGKHILGYHGVFSFRVESNTAAC